MKRVLMLLAACVAGAAVAAETYTEAFPHPVLRCPRMAKAPTLDGKIDPAEWQDAAAFTGFAGNPLGRSFLLLEAQQPVWYMGWHDGMIYLAMASPHPKGTFPVGRVKDDDNPDVLWGDHTEVQFLTNKREDAGKPGKGFYKIMSNAWGATQDTWWYNGTPGTEDLWDMGGDVACQVTDSMWTLEMSLSAERIKLRKLPGGSAVVQLVRASDTGGLYYAGWVGEAWMAWQKFAAVTFDAEAPALQFTRLGEVMEGQLNLPVTLRGHGQGPQQVEVTVLVEDAAGKALYQESKPATLQPGQAQTLSFQAKDLPVSEVDIEGERNHLEIQAVWIDGKRRTVLYHDRSPFMKMTPAWRAKYYDPWVAQRPKSGEWESVFAYWPYSHKVQASVDVDFFGMKEAIRQADAFRVEVRAKGNDKVLASDGGKLEGGAGKVFFDCPDLPDGDYTATFTLLGADGQPVTAKTEDFVRKRYEWERNEIGKQPHVIPPYLPMEVHEQLPPQAAGRPRTMILQGGGFHPRHYVGGYEGTQILVWGRAYQLGGYGLIDQVLATPPTGTLGRPEKLLAAPVRLELRQGGQLVEMADPAAEIVSAAEHEVKIKGQARAGDVNVQVNATEEYDGWYQVDLELAPRGDAVTVDGLDLVVDLRDHAGDRGNPVFPVDTLYVQRMGGGVDNSLQSGIPRQPGIHYRSTELWPAGGRTGPCDLPKDWKSFAPIAYVGNGDRGMWFFAWSDIGWKLVDDAAMLEVERLADGNVRLRVRLIAGDVQLDGPRRLRFALQAAPIKANDSEYRTRIAEIAHDTSGYRYYGDSVDSFALHTEEDFAALRKFLLWGTQGQPDDQGGRYNHWGGRLGLMLRRGDATRLMMYGSQWMTGLGAEEFDSFGGAWLGKSNWEPNPDLKFTDKWNYGHTVKWDTPRELTPRRVNWPESMVDFFVYYHDKLIDKAGFNGTWWDNCYSGWVTDYDAETGRLETKWNILMRRELCKRLNVAGWDHMRPPCWSMNTEVEMAWNQVYWMVEGFWGPSSKDISAIDHFGGVDFFRAASRPKTSCMIPKTSYLGHFRGSTPEKDRAMQRSADAILLLHDIQPHFDKELVRKLEYLLDYRNVDDCLFGGYWATGQMVDTGDPAVKASIYQNAKRGRAVIVFMNTDKKGKYLAGASFHPAGVVATPVLQEMAADRPLGLAEVTDFETDQPVKVLFRNGRFELAEPFVCEGHGFRILSLEAER